VVSVGITPFTIQARLTVNPKTATPGATITASGFGFAAGEKVQVYWKKPNRFLGEATTDTKGTFAGASALSLKVPTGAAPGTNLIYGDGQSSLVRVYSSVTIQ
jgi:hypothetical protein